MKRIAFLFLLSPAFAGAQIVQDSAELEPVEVKAVRASATAPFAKTNLSRRDVEKQNTGQDLPFLLNQTPSTVVNSDAGNAIGYTGIRIRGTDATRINVTLNGIPYNDAESGGTFFVNLPDFASSVGSIQIQRGVGTSTNGPGAFGATINLSTNEVSRDPYAAFNNSYGSFNTWKNTVKAGTGLIGGHFTTDVRLSRITSDGYVDRAKTDLKAFYFSTAYLSDKTSLRLNIFSGKEKTYQAWNGITEADLKSNRRVNYSGTEKPGTPYDNETDNYTQTHYQLFFTQQLSKHLVFTNGLFLVKGRGYYEQYKSDRDYADYGLPDRIFGTDTFASTDLVRQLWLDNDYYGDVFSFQYEKNRTRLQGGGSLSRYDGSHFGEVIWAANGMATPKHRWYDQPALKNDISFYGKWQQQLGKGFELFTDLQYRFVDYDLEGFRDNPQLHVKTQYHFFNPKLGITYHRSYWTAYASYSIGNKEPNRDDFEAGAEQQPKHERLGDVEAGLEYKKGRAAWSANFYYMKYKNQLILTGMINDVGAYTRTNIRNSYRMGVELQGGVQATDWLRATGNLTLSNNKVKNFTEYLDDWDNGGQKINQYRETDIALSPDIIGAATITFTPFKSFNIDLISKYVGEQYLDNTSNDARKLDAYYTQDVRVNYIFSKKWLKNTELILQVNNVFNERYEANGYTYSYYLGNQLTTENYYFPMAGTNWMLGVHIKL